jgi:hypothetical protein
MNARTPYPSANPINRPIANVIDVTSGDIRSPIHAFTLQKTPRPPSFEKPPETARCCLTIACAVGGGTAAEMVLPWVSACRTRGRQPAHLLRQLWQGELVPSCKAQLSSMVSFSTRPAVSTRHRLRGRQRLTLDDGQEPITLARRLDVCCGSFISPSRLDGIPKRRASRCFLKSPWRYQPPRKCRR